MKKKESDVCQCSVPGKEITHFGVPDASTIKNEENEIKGCQCNISSEKSNTQDDRNLDSTLTPETSKEKESGDKKIITLPIIDGYITIEVDNTHKKESTISVFEDRATYTPVKDTDKKVNKYSINPRTKDYILIDDLKPEDISYWENFGHFKEPL